MSGSGVVRCTELLPPDRRGRLAPTHFRVAPGGVLHTALALRQHNCLPGLGRSASLRQSTSDTQAAGERARAWRCPALSVRFETPIDFLPQRAETYLPRTDLLRHEDAVSRPRIRRKALDDLGCCGGAKNEERITRALQRTHKDSESLLEQLVHECSMGYPVRLILQRLRVVPGRAARAQDHECVFHPVSNPRSGSGIGDRRRRVALGCRPSTTDGDRELSGQILFWDTSATISPGKRNGRRGEL